MYVFLGFQVQEELQLSSNSAAKADSAKKKRRRESHVSPDTLLTWFQKQLSSYDCVAVTDMTYSFQNGLALCAIIHRYRPELLEFQCLDSSVWAENNQLAFDILENALGIPPVMTGKELATSIAKVGSAIQTFADAAMNKEATSLENQIIDVELTILDLEAEGKKEDHPKRRLWAQRIENRLKKLKPNEANGK